MTGRRSIPNLYPNQLKNSGENEHKSLLSHTSMTLNEGQGHQNCYQSIQFTAVYHYAKFERNWWINFEYKQTYMVLLLLLLLLFGGSCSDGGRRGVCGFLVVSFKTESQLLVLIKIGVRFIIPTC